MEPLSLVHYISQYGIIFIFFIVFLEYLNIPGIPGGIILPLAGMWASNSGVNIFIVLGISVIAGVIGSWVLYFLGRRGGNFFIEKYTRKFPKHKPIINKSMDKLRVYGNLGVFLCKFIPTVRTLISIPAGVLKLDFVKYTVYSTLGILIWNGVFIGAGYMFGDTVLQVLI